MSKKGKGGKNKRKGKKQQQETKRELEFKDDGQEYAQVTKMLGNGRVEALCLSNNNTVLAHIRGAFRKRVWIVQGDIVLLGLRDYQDEKADIILKYSLDEARTLQAYGEIPTSVVIGVQQHQTDDAGATGATDDLAFGSDQEEEQEQSETSLPEEDNDDEAWDEKLKNL